MAIVNVVERQIRYYSPTRQPTPKLEVKSTDIIANPNDKKAAIFMSLTPSGITTSFIKR